MNKNAFTSTYRDPDQRRLADLPAYKITDEDLRAAFEPLGGIDEFEKSLRAYRAEHPYTDAELRILGKRP